MKIYKYLAFLGLGSFLLTMASCDVENPIETEQYKKQVYLVGAHDRMLQKNLSYGGEQEIYVSVAVGGSLKTEHDITVTLGEADKVNIDNYNRKNVAEGDVKYEALPLNWYTIPSKTVTIKAGEQYARIPIRIETDRIDADKCYTIPLKIVELSDFEVTRDDTVMILNPVMVNNYSGSGVFAGKSYSVSYDGTGNEVIGSVASTTNTNRTLKAIDQYTVRLFHKVELEKLSNVDKSAYTLKVNPADNTVIITPCKNLEILKGGGVYDPSTHTFSIWYNYKEGGSEYKMEATIVVTV